MISFDAFRAQNGSPIYLQILRYIKRGIVTGDIVDGDALPSRRMLSAMLGVNPNTIQKAYRILEEDGLITSHAGAKSVIVLNDENRASVRQELLQDDIRQTAAVLRGMGLSLAERLVTQHREMERLCGESIAVIRVVTVNNIAVFACLNSVCGKVKLTAPINEKTGLITSSAVDEQNGMYHRHPLTDRRFYGFKIPLWNDIVSFTERASLVLSSVKYCGFDIAVLPDKPELIDATSFPRHDYYRVCDNSVLRRKIEQRI